MRIKEDIPIIFIHRGLQDYLKYAVVCAKDHQNRVILIGDDENKCVEAEWCSITEYKSLRFNTFKENYIHLSSNSRWFELLCFERYFVLLEFMKKNKMERCVMMDSDVLLFGKADEICSSQNFDMGAGFEEKYKQVNPCVLYWSIPALEQFVMFCIKAYRNDYTRGSLISIYKKLKKKNIRSYGGISDMTLLYFWIKVTAYKCNNLFSYELDFFIDGNCSFAEQNRILYKMRKILKIKKIKFKSKVPYIIDQNMKRKKVIAIHCQGGAKKYMNMFCKGYSCVLLYYIILIKCNFENILENIKKV